VSQDIEAFGETPLEPHYSRVIRRAQARTLDVNITKAARMVLEGVCRSLSELSTTDVEFAYAIGTF
jgi:hypothetical protein